VQTLDRRGLAQAQVFSLRRGQPGIADCGAAQPAAFRKREGNPRPAVRALDQPALKPLPATRYQFGQWKTAGVNIDYHMNRAALLQRAVRAGAPGGRRAPDGGDPGGLHRGWRVASHVRSYEPGKSDHPDEHMPKAHQKYVGRTPSRLIEDAQQIGLYRPVGGKPPWRPSAIRRWIPVPVWEFALAKTIPQRMEAAARRASAGSRLQLPEHGPRS